MENTDEELLQTAQNHQEQGKYPQAIAAYRKVLELNPQNVQAWVDLGICYGNIGNKEMSMMALVRAIQIQSTETRAWSELGKFFEARRMRGEAAFCKQEAGETPQGKKVKLVSPRFWNECTLLKNEFFKPKCINCGGELPLPVDKNRIVECKSCHYFSWWYMNLDDLST